MGTYNDEVTNEYQQKMYILSHAKSDRNRPVVVNLNNIPRESLDLLHELSAATLGGDVSGLGVFAIRRHGLPPIVSVTDSAVDCPAIALGLAARLTYLLNRRFNERD